MIYTELCTLLGIEYPILQGAMQGGGGPGLVAAVCEAGGLGVLPTFGGTESGLREDIAAVQALTRKPFAVNITPMGQGFTDSRVQIAIEMGVPIMTTGRADPGPAAVKRMKQAGQIVISVVPTVAHAVRMEAEGVDVIVASGTEAGGHVGHIATLPLVPMVVDAVSVPVVAAGGIGDARGMLAAFALGAVGVQLGTRLLAAAESDVGGWVRTKMLSMQETETVVSKAMTGATVRCIATAELLAYEKARQAGAQKAELSTLLRAVRAGRNTDDSAAKRQSAMGQVAGMIDQVQPVAEIFQDMMRGTGQHWRSLGLHIEGLESVEPMRRAKV